MKCILLYFLTFFLVAFCFAQPTVSVVKSTENPMLIGMEDTYFVSANEGWIIGTDARILHTTDGGDNWTVQSYVVDSDTTFYDVFFLDNMTGWVVGNDGVIWKTTDGGSNWASQTSAITDENLRDVFAFDANTIFAVGGGSTYGVVLKSDDGGTNWSLEVDGAPRYFYGVYAWDANRAFAISGGVDAAVYYYNTDSTYWVSTTIPVPPTAFSARQYACDGASGGIGYSFAYSGAVYKTIDYGKTWTNTAVLYMGTNLFYCGATYGANHVWGAGSDGMLCYSNDAGVSWDTSAYPSKTSIKSINIIDENNFHVFADYNQCFSTTDGGATFTPILDWPSVSFYAINSINQNDLIAITYQGGDVTKSNDIGQTWSYPINTTHTNSVKDVVFVNDNVGYFAAGNGTIGKSTDGGDTWTLKPNSREGETKHYHFIHFKDAQNGFLGGSSAILQFTHDGGETWTEEYAGASSTLYDGLYLNDSTGIACGSSGKIFKTTQGDTGWAEVVDFGSMSMREMEFITDQIGFAVSSSGYIFKTEDGGDTWVEKDTLENLNSPGDAPDLYVVRFVNDTTGFICGEDGAFYLSTDAGDSWVQISVPEETKDPNFQGMMWLNENNGFIVTQDGFIIKVEVITSIENPGHITPESIRLYTNYPNPFNPTTTIAYEIKKPANIELTIYDLQGRKVRNLVDTHQNFGKYSIVWDGKNNNNAQVSSGVYMYQLKIDNVTLSKKMVMLK